MGVRVLLAEDDPSAVDFLTVALEGRGHAVSVVGNGIDALNAMRTDSFDVALFDYHLPELDGAASARVMQKVFEQPGTAPRMIAVTADAEGLAAESDSGQLFEMIVPKPIQMKQLISVIEMERPSSDPTYRLPPAIMNWRRAPALILPRRSGPLAGPIDAAFDCTRPEQAEAMVIVDEVDIETIQRERRVGYGHVLPVIDTTGRFSAMADVTFSASDPASWSAVKKVLASFSVRRQSLAPALQHAARDDDRLLVAIYMSGSALEPRTDPQTPECFSYNPLLPADSVQAAATRLEQRGFLEKSFVDRVHHCNNCQSARLNVREECPTCRSAALQETSIIHHFRCAYQGPEADFRRADDLICPKCRQHLVHYGSDYDRPGDLLQCASCGNSNTDPAIGFSCLDCNSHFDGDAVSTRDIHRYVLTDTALRYLTTSPAEPLRIDRRSAFRTSLPDDVQAQVDAFYATETGDRAEFTLCEISYLRQSDIVIRKGPAAFDKLRELFMENLRNYLRQYGQVVPGSHADYLFVNGFSTDQFGAYSDQIIERCSDVLAEPIDVEVKMFGPEDLLAS